MRGILHILLLVALSHLLRAQDVIHNLDTVTCSMENTSYLIFPHHVDFVDLGKPKAFTVMLDGDAVLIKVLKPQCDSSTLLVRCGSEYWEGFVIAVKHNKKYFYSLLPQEHIRIKDSLVHIKKSTADSAQVMKNKMAAFCKYKTERLDLGFISSSLDAAITVVRNDNRYTYLKFLIQNKTSIPYKLDFISFQYYQHLSRGFFRKAKKGVLDVFPVQRSDLKEIDPLRTQAMVYVIPSFGLSDSGYLLVLFRERTGDRILKIKVDGHVIQKSPVLEPLP